MGLVIVSYGYGWLWLGGNGWLRLDSLLVMVVIVSYLEG